MRTTVRILMTISLLKRVGTFGAALLLACGIFTMRAEAQIAPPILGEIAGDDISVLGPSSVVEGNVPREISFGGGSTVIVHSGKARVEFVGGGELEICGPAKFSVLASGEALTIALSFGRVHVRFDASRPITIYTPLIVATPMAIGDRPRDMTIGVMTTGAMCVLAARGAVQVQQQLSGEMLVVPQPSEVLLQGTPLGPAPAASGSCRCDFDEPGAQKLDLPAAVVVQQEARHELTPRLPEPSTQNADKSSRPVNNAAAPQTSASAQRGIVKTDESKQPIAKIDLPPIGYDAGSATDPAEPISVATLLLAKEVTVQPEWIFHGTVAEPPRPRKPVRTGAAQRTTQTSVEQQSKKHATKKGFWAKLRAFFVGSPNCVDEGCG